VSPSERIPYRKLPGDCRGFLRRNTLWIGGDHVLQVDSSRFSETYKRFYLRDIQTIIIRKTPRFRLPYYWVLLAAIAVITLLAGLNPFKLWLFWPPVAVLAGVVIYLYVAGMFQSCTCHLITRVNRMELPSLFRLETARRFADVMAPLISAAQGNLPPDWLERSTTLEELTTAADQNPDHPVELLAADEFSWISVVVFLLVLVDGGLTWLQLRTNDATAFTKPNTVNMIALATCATIAIVRLTRRQGSRALRMMVLAGLFVVAGVTYGSMLLQSFDQQFYHETATNPLLYTGMRPLAFGEIIMDVAVALPGLALAFRRNHKT